MGLFDKIRDFFNKTDKGAPPDVGREVSSAPGTEPGMEAPYDPGESESSTEESEDEEDEEYVSKKGKKGKKEKVKESKTDAMTGIKLAKIEAQMEGLNSLIKGFNERFSNINQQIGEVRGMALANEKSVTKLSVDASKAIDVVNAVKPEKIRFDYERLETKSEELGGRIDSNKQYMENIMNELKEIRRKAESFIGTESLLSLQEDVKKDLLNIQHINNKARIHADKSEQLFIEMKKSVAEYNQLIETVNNFEANYAGLKKEVEKIKLDFTNIATKGDISSFKKEIEGKLANLDSTLSFMNRVKDDNDRILRLTEINLSLAKQNQSDINDIAMTIGDDHISRVSEYDSRLNSILGIVDSLAGQINSIKKKVGMKNEKVSVEKVPEQTGESIKLDNLDINPEVSEKLLPVKKEVPEVIQKIKDKAETSMKEIDDVQEIKELKGENQIKEEKKETDDPLENELKGVEKKDDKPLDKVADLDKLDLESESKPIDEKKESEEKKDEIKEEKKDDEKKWTKEVDESSKENDKKNKKTKDKKEDKKEKKEEKKESEEKKDVKKEVKKTEDKESPIEAESNSGDRPLPPSLNIEKEKPTSLGIWDKLKNLGVRLPNQKVVNPMTSSLYTAEMDAIKYDDIILEHINDLISRGYSFLDSGNKEDLLNHYENIKSVYEMLSEHDQESYDKITNFYNELIYRFY